ncbi:MAG: ABC transporter ATP-binding protein [Candidatus Omnitrophica bacterium]|nr:ABC transporter ATP-binding protein [Candidatus Omnitrophota bacterium]MDE2008971.1 ABC transporter ATP-binding protein [Candidatus Omnitrophota bacterium]MDE2214495.1 ABC transporter ATP-binding protein [Candidatus Omnitrophota bacterium]MDE2230813.1 ABC transporter ATP-binding protein [Candidatus Omnitrophota bacterium]
MNAICIKGLVKTYRTGTQALKGVDLSIADGDFFALLGANGAGKTTIIGILTGLVTKTGGKVEIFGHDIDTDFEAAKKSIGVVPQEFNFHMFEQVQDIVVNQAGYFGIDHKTALKDSQEILKRVGLWEKRKAISRTLSGGMKRRLMIARGLIHHPRMLILDEPTAGVDVELRHGMWEYLRQINAAGTTILLTTHYLEEVEQMCNNCAIIKEGEIVLLDNVRHLLTKVPQDTYRVTVKEMLSLDQVRSFNPVKIDEHTLDIEIQKREELNEVILKLAQSGFVITDFHPKGNRLEKLFLEIVQR